MPGWGSPREVDAGEWGLWNQKIFGRREKTTGGSGERERRRAGAEQGLVRL